MMTDTLRQILAELPTRYDETSVRPMTVSLQIVADGSGGGEFVMQIEGGRLSITDGRSRRADATILVSTRDLVDLLRHRISAIKLISEGRLRVKGSLPHAARAYVLISRITRTP